ADAGAPGEAPVHVGHERRALLMVACDELDLAGEQRVHDVDVLLAGNSIDVLDALVLEAAHEELGGGRGPGGCFLGRLLLYHGGIGGRHGGLGERFRPSYSNTIYPLMNSESCYPGLPSMRCGMRNGLP